MEVCVMSTGNFNSGVKFGIYCFEPYSYTNKYIKCDECDTYNPMYDEEMEQECDCCGEPLDLNNIQYDIDYCDIENVYIPEIEKSFSDLKCKFHKMRFEGGYYESAQIVVDEV